MSEDFAPQIEEAIRDTLRDALGAAFFKDYYIGDPGLIPASSLPCLMVFRRRTGFDQRYTGQDQRNITVIVRIALNQRSDWGKGGKEVTTFLRLRNLVEGEDLTTGDVSDNTVVGVLRKELTVGNRLVGNVADIDYPDPRDRGSEITTECDITLTLERSSLVAGRQ